MIYCIKILSFLVNGEWDIIGRKLIILLYIKCIVLKYFQL